MGWMELCTGTVSRNCVAELCTGSVRKDSHRPEDLHWGSPLSHEKGPKIRQKSFIILTIRTIKAANHYIIPQLYLINVINERKVD